MRRYCRLLKDISWIALIRIETNQDAYRKFYEQFYHEVMPGPSSSASGGCCDADAACSGMMLYVCIFSNKEQVSII
jgi:hypothetical protein